MRKFIRFYCLLLLIVAITTNLQAQYSISGATTSEVNGIYLEKGIEEGKPYYSNGTYILIYSEDEKKWVVEFVSEDKGGPSVTIFYSTIVDGDLPPSEGWNKGKSKDGSIQNPIMVAKINSIAYDKKGFVESVSDDGSCKDTINMLLYSPENPLTGTNNEDFVATGKIVVNNLPTGLTPVVKRTSDTTLMAFFTGYATNHTKNDNIDNLTFAFQNSAFTDRDAMDIEHSTSNDLKVMFFEKYIVSDATKNIEVNDTFFLTGIFNQKPYYTNGEYNINYRGCKAKWVVQKNLYSGCPEYSTSIDGDNIPAKGWYDGGEGAGKSDTICIHPMNSIVYNKNKVFEFFLDEGSIADSITISFVAPTDNNKFTGTNGDDFIADSKIIVSNLPSGLIVLATRTGDTTLTIKFIGNADRHNYKDNISNLNIEFQNSAFANGNATQVDNYLKTGISIFFLKKYEVIDATSTPEVNGTYFLTGTNNGNTVYSKGEYRLGYRGCGSTWVIVGGDENSNIGRHTCPLYSTGVVSDVVPSKGWAVGGCDRDYSEPIYVISHNSIFFNSNSIKESFADDGTIDDTIAITYFFPAEGNKFTGTIGNDFIADGKIIISNLPSGLTAIASLTTDTTITIKFTGNADSHAYLNNINNLSVEFQNTAFVNGDATEVENCLKDDIDVVFLMKYEIFNAVNEPEMNGTYVSKGAFNGKPIFSNGKYRLGYRACPSSPAAPKWVIVDGDSDNNVAAGYCPLSKTDVDGDLPPLNGWEVNSVDLYPHNSLYYEKNTFEESLLNKNSIDNSDTLIISYFHPQNFAIFSGVNNEDFVAEGKVTVPNLPIGLTAFVTRKSDTTLAVVLTGKSCSEDVNDLTISFSDNAFIGTTAEEVWFSSKNDLKINFHNSYYVASTGGDFTTIKDAVEDPKVDNGDVIYISDEIYTVTDQISVKKSLTFIGQGAGKTIIQANASPAAANNRLFRLYFYNGRNNNVCFQDMTIQNGNVSGEGGAIYARYCNLTIKNCEIKKNRITSIRGGAIYFRGGYFVAENITFSDNSIINGSTAGNFGGGALYLREGNASITNCTFIGNKVDSLGHVYGGALFSEQNTKIYNSTFVNNSAYNGGGINSGEGTIEMLNVLVANNTAKNLGNDIQGSFTANYCLIEDETGATITGANNVTGLDPEISGLDNNGGHTQTCAISSTSPAKDAGTNNNVPLIDQRGVPVFNTTKDIGAYEFNSESAIMVSDTVINFGNVVKGKTAELRYSLSAINLIADLVVTAPEGLEISTLSGSEFVGESTITITPKNGFVSDTIIYAQCTSNNVGFFENIITHESTDAETINTSVKRKIIDRPTGEDDSFVVLQNTEKEFTADNFVFNDEDGDIFSGIKIITKETNGDLEYNDLNISDGTICDDISKLIFKPYENERGLAYATFTFKVKDNFGLYSVADYTMTIDVNDIPEGSNETLTTNEDADLIFANEDFTFTNTVGGFDGIQIVSVQTAGELNYDGIVVISDLDCPDVTKLVFTPADDANGDTYASFDFKVKDALGAESEIYTMTINVTAVNDAPTVANEMPDDTAQVGVAYNYEVPENTFVEIDEGDELKYSAKLNDGNDLPVWLSFDVVTRIFSGTPDVAGSITLKVTATDEALTSISDEFVLTIATATGIEDVFGNSLSIYPNPTSGVITISLDRKYNDVDVSIIDIIGETIMRKSICSTKTVINMEGYSKGMYFIKFSNKEQTITRKIIVE
ncbi:MAG: T9SS type A sorting domain-containing protein [Bacteroidetes bacterium]|nr:T9SS type A sorting domain-containing protein [Bacteroidota bacterium]